MIGIYCYEDTLKDNKIVYVGKDSHIHENRRHKEHMWPSRYNKQPINSILQKNKGRYKYRILKSWNGNEHPKNLADILEILYIRRYKPKFNFTIGGDGSKGYQYTDEQRKKLSEIHKGQVPWNKGKPNCFKHTEEAKEKIRKAQTGENNSMYGKPAWNKGITGKDNHTYKDYFRLVKDGKSGNKQQYSIIKNRKRFKRSVDIDKLLTWFKENYPNEEIKEMNI